MWVEVTGEVFNHFQRIVPIGSVIKVDEERGRYLIRNDRVRLVSRNPQNEYQNQINKMKSDKDRADQPPPETRQRSWFGRLFGD